MLESRPMREFGKFFLSEIEGQGFDVIPVKFIPLVKRHGTKAEVHIYTKKGVPVFMVYLTGSTFSVFSPSQELQAA